MDQREGSSAIHSSDRTFGKIDRKYSRIGVPGVVGNIADGKKALEGTIGNISAGGFQITNLPASFTADSHSYIAVLSNGGKHFRMLVKPCWKMKTSANSVNIGFKILDASWEWVEFTLDQAGILYEN